MIFDFSKQTKELEAKAKAERSGKPTSTSIAKVAPRRRSTAGSSDDVLTRISRDLTSKGSELKPGDKLASRGQAKFEGATPTASVVTPVQKSTKSIAQKNMSNPNRIEWLGQQVDKTSIGRSPELRALVLDYARARVGGDESMSPGVFQSVLDEVISEFRSFGAQAPGATDRWVKYRKMMEESSRRHQESRSKRNPYDNILAGMADADESEIAQVAADRDRYEKDILNVSAKQPLSPDPAPKSRADVDRLRRDQIERSQVRRVLGEQYTSEDVDQSIEELGPIDFYGVARMGQNPTNLAKSIAKTERSNKYFGGKDNKSLIAESAFYAVQPITTILMSHSGGKGMDEIDPNLKAVTQVADFALQWTMASAMSGARGAYAASNATKVANLIAKYPSLAKAQPAMLATMNTVSKMGQAAPEFLALDLPAFIKMVDDNGGDVGKAARLFGEQIADGFNIPKYFDPNVAIDEKTGMALNATMGVILGAGAYTQGKNVLRKAEKGVNGFKNFVDKLSPQEWSDVEAASTIAREVRGDVIDAEFIDLMAKALIARGEPPREAITKADAMEAIASTDPEIKQTLTDVVRQEAKAESTLEYYHEGNFESIAPILLNLTQPDIKTNLPVSATKSVNRGTNAIRLIFDKAKSAGNVVNAKNGFALGAISRDAVRGVEVENPEDFDRLYQVNSLREILDFENAITNDDGSLTIYAKTTKQVEPNQTKPADSVRTLQTETDISKKGTSARMDRDRGNGGDGNVNVAANERRDMASQEIEPGRVLRVEDTARDMVEEPRLSAIDRESKLVAGSQKKATVSPRLANTATDNSSTLESQYNDVKAKYPDTLIGLRDGDYYRFYGDDATTVASILNTTLSETQNGLPVTLLPYKSIELGLKTLVSKGHKVGLADENNSAKKVSSASAPQGVPTNDIDTNLSDTAKRDKLVELAKENYDIITSVLNEAYHSLGISFKTGVKAPAKILEKANRSSIKDRKPWYGIEHISDGARFAVEFTQLDAIETIINALPKGTQIAKLDIEKIYANDYGWRMIAIDLKMANGGLVEAQFVTPEMAKAKKYGHAIYEKWRSVPAEQYVNESSPRYAENSLDMAESLDNYEVAWKKDLETLGYADDTAVIAALMKLDFSSPGGKLEKLSSTSDTPTFPARQAPDDSLTAKKPDLASDTYTRPSSETITTARDSSITSSNNIIPGLSEKPTKPNSGTTESTSETPKSRTLGENADGETKIGETASNKSGDSATDAKSKKKSKIDDFRAKNRARIEELDKIREANLENERKRRLTDGAIKITAEDFEWVARKAIESVLSGAESLEAALARLFDAERFRPNEEAETRTILNQLADEFDLWEDLGLENPQKGDTLNANDTTDSRDARSNGDAARSSSREARGDGRKRDSDELPGKSESKVPDNGAEPDERRAGAERGAGGRERDIARGAEPERVERTGRTERTTGDTGQSVESFDVDGSNAEKPKPKRSVTDLRVSVEDATESIAKTDSVRKKRLFESLSILKDVEETGRSLTENERKTLLAFPGWGWTGNMMHDANKSASATHHQFYTELRALLSETEWQNARKAKLNSHYTHPMIVDGLWRILDRIGLKDQKNLRMLEPAAGNGLIPALGPKNGTWDMVELDSMSAQVLKAIHGDAKSTNDIQQTGYQDALLGQNYDLTISNVPFGSYTISDPAFYKKTGLPSQSIHNYFIAKMLTQTRDNGYVVAITTRFTLDSTNIDAVEFRNWLAANAELITAIRLPSGAFRENASTDVVTDILVLRKLRAGEKPVAAEFLDMHTARVYSEKNGFSEVRFNKYFDLHPENVLGKHSNDGKMYGGKTKTKSKTKKESDEEIALKEQIAQENLRSEYTVHYRGQNFKQSLHEVIDRIPERKMAKGDNTPIQLERPVTRTSTNVKEGAIFEQDGKFYRSANSFAEPIEVDLKDAAMVRDFISLRDDLNSVFNAMRSEGYTDGTIKSLQANLTQSYEAYVKSHGPINKIPASNLPWVSDIDAYLVIGLERYDRKTKSVKDLADVFTKRVLAPYSKITKADNPHDALIASLQNYGKVDLAQMSKMSGISKADLLADLKGKVFFDRTTKTYVTADVFSRGNLRLKIKQAEKAGDVDSVEFLKRHAPPLVGPEDIVVLPGATWVPVSVYEAFAQHLMQSTSKVGTIRYIRGASIWSVDFNFHAKHSVQATQVWGTPRRNFSQLFEYFLKGQDPLINTKEDGVEVADEKATQQAAEVLARMRSEWTDWLWSDADRSKLLIDEYNENINVYGTPVYDASHMTFPTMTSKVNERTHRGVAVWRALTQKATYLAHDMGTGKTLTSIAIAIEARRTGVAKKPMIVVKNGTAGQFAVELQESAPGSKVLVADDTNFTGDKRKQFIGQVASGDWDAVILTQSSFELIQLSSERQNTFFNTLADELKRARALIDEYGDDHTSKSVGQIGTAIDSIEKEIAKRKIILEKQDPNTTFDSLGVDMLIVDEAHNYKNLYTASRIDFMSKSGSQRAFDMLMKSEYMHELEGGKIIMMSGTPISNSVVEMHTLLRYMAPQQLNEMGVSHFDEFASTYLTFSEEWERTVSGAYKKKERLTSFQNIPELMRLYLQITHRVDTADIVDSNGEQLVKLPKTIDFNGREINGPIVELLPYSQEQQAYWKTLTARDKKLQSMSRHEAKASGDNMLVIASDGRKSSIDLRLVKSNADDDPNSKINRAVENIVQIHKWSNNDKGTQLVFLDFGVPNRGRKKVSEASKNRQISQPESDADSGMSNESENLDKVGLINLYEDMREKLVAQGISRDEIVFIQSFKESELEAVYQKIRDGVIRVMIGSTAKMAEGLNVQDRLIALHRMNAGWTPASHMQGDRRILRSGNMFKDRGVYIINYVTTDSFDLFMWSTQARKEKFIKQIVGWQEGSARSVENEADDAMTSTMIQAIATGNPDLARFIQLNDTTQKLKEREERFRQQIQGSFVAERIARTNLEQEQKALSKIERSYNEVKPGLAKMTVVIGGEKFKKPYEAAKTLYLMAREFETEGSSSKKEMATIDGTELAITYHKYGMSNKAVGPEWSISLNGKSVEFDRLTFIAPVKIGALTNDEDLKGGASSLANFITSFPSKVDDLIKRSKAFIDTQEKTIEAQVAKQQRPSPYRENLLKQMAELEAVRERLGLDKDGKDMHKRDIEIGFGTSTIESTAKDTLGKDDDTRTYSMSMDRTGESTQPTPRLPKELAQSSPGYAYQNKVFTIKFNSDYDKAAYVIDGAGKSKAHDRFVEWATENNFGLDEMRERGAKIRRLLKEKARDAEAETELTYEALKSPSANANANANANRLQLSELFPSVPMHRYKNNTFSIDFKRDIDKVAYVLAGDTTAKGYKEVADWAFRNGHDLEKLRARGKDIIAQLNEQAKTAEPKSVLSYKGKRAGADVNEDSISQEAIEIDPLGPSGVDSQYLKSGEQILRELADDLEKDIKHKRMGGRNLRGEYNPIQKLVAIRFSGDVRAAMHELGHWLNDVHQLDGKFMEADVELLPLSKKHVAKDATLVVKRREGFAEYVHSWAINPEAAETTYPKTTKIFKDAIPAKQVEALRKAGDALRVLQAQTYVDATKTRFVRTDPDGSTAEGVMNTVRSLFGKLPNERTKGMKFAKDFSYNFTDDLAPMLMSVREIRTRLGLPADFDMSEILDDPIALARSLNYSAQKFQETLISGMIDAEGRVVSRPLVEMFEHLDNSTPKALEEDLYGLYTYMAGERTIEKGKIIFDKARQKYREILKDGQRRAEESYDDPQMQSRILKKAKDRANAVVAKAKADIYHISGLTVNGEPDLSAAKGILNEVENDPARKLRYSKAAEIYREYANAGLEYMVEKGRMSREDVDLIKSENQQYVAFNRLVNDYEDSFMFQPSKGLAATRNIVKRWVRGNRQIHSPLVSLMKQAEGIIREADRNEALVKFFELIEDGIKDQKFAGNDPVQLDDIAFKVPVEETPLQSVVKVFRNGVEQHWVIADKGLYDAFTAAGQTLDHPGFLKFLRGLAQFQRTAITSYPVFSLILNPIRDNLSRLVVTRNSSGFAEMLKNVTPEEKRLYALYGGGIMESQFANKTSYYKVQAEMIRRFSKDKKTHFIDNMADFGNAYLKFMNQPEVKNRISEYRAAYQKAIDAGMSEHAANTYAMGEARDLMDFMRAGKVIRHLNVYIPFLNAQVQGWSKTSRAIKDDPQKVGVRWALAILAPTLLVYLLNQAMGEDNMEEYRQLPAYQRDMFWNIKAGDMGWIRIPKPFEMGLLASGFERMVDSLSGGSLKKNVQGYSGSLRSNATMDMFTLLGAATPAFEIAVNKDTFRNEAIVPEYEDDIVLSLREGTKTASITSQFLQPYVKMDARHIDHLVKSYAGRYGKAGIDVMNLLKSRDKSLPDKEQQRYIGPATWLSHITGLTTDVPGMGSTDVQWVLDTERSYKARGALRAELDELFATDNMTARAAAAKQLREKATLIRKAFEDEMQRVPASQRDEAAIAFFKGL